MTHFRLFRFLGWHKLSKNQLKMFSDPTRKGLNLYFSWRPNHFSSNISHTRIRSLQPPIFCSSLSYSRHKKFSSFIQQVMTQIQKDLEENVKLRKSLEELKKSQWIQKSYSLYETQDYLKKNFYRSKTKVLSFFFNTLNHETFFLSPIINSIQYCKTHFFLHPKVQRALKIQLSFYEWVSHVISNLLNKILAYFEDDSPKLARSRVERWRKSRMCHQKETQNSHLHNIGEKNKILKNHEDSNETTSLTVVKESGWETFGTTLRDMPFLRNFFAHPAIGMFFGNTLQSIALNEIKKLDPTFRFSEFLELVEHVIVPQVLSSFLLGDRQLFKMQCRHDVYNLVDQCFKEREMLNISLDPTVLRLYNVEFRGAAKFHDVQPWLVFTFVAQQIHCLRDQNNRVVQGADDDIREVMYSLALTRHPEPNQQGLHYPWQITEFAVLGNTPYCYVSCSSVTLCPLCTIEESENTQLELPEINILYMSRSTIFWGISV